MDFAIRSRLLARAFVDAQTVAAPTVDDVAGLAKAMAQPDLTVGPTIVEAATLRQSSLLSWGNSGWQLALLGGSFDVTRLGTLPGGENLADLSAFATRASDVLAVATDYFGRIPHRLVLAQDGLFEEMTPERLDAIALRFLRLPPGLETYPPFEWDWRYARHSTLRLGVIGEETNIVATVKRAAGVLQMGGLPLPFDRIQVELDFNTSAVNTRGRFRAEEIRTFFAAAVREHGTIGAQVESLIKAGGQ